MKTLKVTLIATVAGAAVWYLEIGRMVWPAHPMWAGFLIILALTVALQYAWPDSKPSGQR
jgi:hypothetical protein